MDITIIGVSDTFARNIADWAIEAGHNITFVGPNLSQAVVFVNELGVGKPVGPESPLTDKIMFIAIPYICLQPVLQTYAKELGEKIVVDLLTPIDLDTFHLIHPKAGSTSHEIMMSWSKSKVVKAFNIQFAGQLLTKRNTKAISHDVFLASDDDEAQKLVSQLFDESGFRTINVGSLDKASELEEMGYMQFKESLNNNTY